MTTTARPTLSNLLDRIAGSSVEARPLAIARVLIAGAALVKLFTTLPILFVLESEPLPLPIAPLPSLPWA